MLDHSPAPALDGGIRIRPVLLHEARRQVDDEGFEVEALLQGDLGAAAPPAVQEQCPDEACLARDQASAYSRRTLFRAKLSAATARVGTRTDTSRLRPVTMARRRGIRYARPPSRDQ